MHLFLVKATCPLCGVVKHFISVNEIHRMMCDDCQDKGVEFPEMILAVQREDED